MRENIICGSCELIRYNAQTLLMLEYFEKNVLCLFITNFSGLQMLHGCRTDLIIKCLVNSKKDRNFFLFLPATNQIRRIVQNR